MVTLIVVFPETWLMAFFNAAFIASACACKKMIELLVNIRINIVFI